MTARLSTVKSQAHQRGVVDCLRTDMLVYLAGGIEYSPDKGKAWRAAITPFLLSIGHTVYDPAEDEQKNLTAEERSEFRSWKTGDTQRFRQTVRKIIDWDLDWIERKCDYIVALWDESAQRGAGSSAELTLAYRRGIPVYLVLGMPLAEVSGWVLGCATDVFASFEELKSFLGRKYARVTEPCACCAARESAAKAATGK